MGQASSWISVAIEALTLIVATLLLLWTPREGPAGVAGPPGLGGPTGPADVAGVMGPAGPAGTVGPPPSSPFDKALETLESEDFAHLLRYHDDSAPAADPKGGRALAGSIVTKAHWWVPCLSPTPLGYTNIFSCLRVFRAIKAKDNRNNWTSPAERNAKVGGALILFRDIETALNVSSFVLAWKSHASDEEQEADNAVLNEIDDQGFEGHPRPRRRGQRWRLGRCDSLSIDTIRKILDGWGVDQPPFPSVGDCPQLDIPKIYMQPLYKVEKIAVEAATRFYLQGKK